MELTVGVNSYMELEEAEALITNELFDTDEEYIKWSASNKDTKTKLIIKGTRLVDQLPFLGYKLDLSGTQKLHWPRLINNEKIECPDEIKVGLLVQSLRDKINKGKPEAKLLELGVNSYKVKDASISLDPTKVTKLSNGIYTDIFNDYFKKWVR